MIKSFAVLVLCFVIFGGSAEAREYKFNFYYSWAGLNSDTFFSESALKSNIDSMVANTEREFGVKIVVNFIKPLPFKPPILVNNEMPGIDVNEFLMRNKISAKPGGITFIISDRLWEVRTTSLGTRFTASLAGFADVDQNTLFLEYREEIGKDIYSSFLHEWGHLLGLPHTDEQICNNIYFIMCARTQKKPYVIESSLKDAIRSNAIFIKSLGN